MKDGDTVSIVPSVAGGRPVMTGAPAAPPEPATAELSKDEILRYSRHLIMPEVGTEGQLKLKAAKVLLVGTGGLGAPLGLYLAGRWRRGPHRPGGFRRGGLHQPAAPGIHGTSDVLPARS